jgi:hypothetical protein
MTKRSASEARSLFPPSLYEAEFVKARCENSFLFIKDYDEFPGSPGECSEFGTNVTERMSFPSDLIEVAR